MSTYRTGELKRINVPKGFELELQAEHFVIVTVVGR
jgi:hypothetical protein